MANQIYGTGWWPTGTSSLFRRFRSIPQLSSALTRQVEEAVINITFLFELTKDVQVYPGLGGIVGHLSSTHWRLTWCCEIPLQYCERACRARKCQYVRAVSIALSSCCWEGWSYASFFGVWDDSVERSDEFEYFVWFRFLIFSCSNIGKDMMAELRTYRSYFISFPNSYRCQAAKNRVG